MGPPGSLKIGLTSPYFGATYGGGEKYLGATAEAARDGFPGCRVIIVGAVPADRHAYQERLALDLAGIELESSTGRLTPVHRALNRIRFLRPLRDRVLAGRGASGTERFAVHLAMAYRIPVHTRARRAAILCQFPYPSGEGVGEFELVICQSEYVRTWVRRYWRRDAVVVHPPIDRPEAEPDWAGKQNRILSVGRFFAGGHSKRHDLMVQAFRGLCDAGLTGWQLDLAGSVHREGPHAGYFEAIARLAEGYPIELHADLGRAELLRLYSRSRIYWHAAGAGSEGGDPEQQEHFGMTVAEAMGHGAVPLAHGSGGLPEIVADGVDGLVWRTEEDLIGLTRQLVEDPARLERLGRAARLASAQFTRARFRAEMQAALRPLVDSAQA